MRTTRSVDGIEPLQGFIRQQRNARCPISQRRDCAWRIAIDGNTFFRFGSLDLFAPNFKPGRQLTVIHKLITTGEHHNRLTVHNKQDALDDLAQRTANIIGGLL